MARSTSSPVALPDASINEVSGGPLILNLLPLLRPFRWTQDLLIFVALATRRRKLTWDACEAPASHR
jgi:hypothetical protein